MKCSAQCVRAVNINLFPPGVRVPVDLKLHKVFSVFN
jgi:hypothetical protein